MFLKAYIVNLLSKIKGENYALDERIPLTYLCRYFLVKVISLIYGQIRLHCLKMVFIHPSVTIKCQSKIKFITNLNIDSGSYIDALSVNGLRLGRNVNIGYNTHLQLSGSLHKIGMGAMIGNNVSLGTHGYYGSGMGELIIGNDVIIGDYVSVHPENHNFSNLDVLIRKQGVYSKGGVIIGNNCWIGAKVTILDGTIIGNNTIVAAGAVVTGKFPDNVVLGGIPAKIIKTLK